MRTNEQGTKRYFGALWSIYLLMQGAVVTIVLVATDRIPDVAVISAMIIQGAMAAVIGFLHGITLFVARERDQEQLNAVGENGEDVG